MYQDLAPIRNKLDAGQIVLYMTLNVPVPGSFFQKLLCWLAHQGKP